MKPYGTKNEAAKRRCFCCLSSHTSKAVSRAESQALIEEQVAEIGLDEDGDPTILHHGSDCPQASRECFCCPCVCLP